MTTRVATQRRMVGPSGIGTGPGNPFGSGGNGDRGGGWAQPLPLTTCRLGLWFGLMSIGMLFIAMTSAYIVRQGLDPGWRTIQIPRLLLLNTLVLLASSLTMEKGRRVQKHISEDLQTGGRLWITATLLLGLIFVGGQLFAWQRLAAKGVYLSTNPHASFFYTLTGLHGIHLLGGIIALTYVVWALWRDRAYTAKPGDRRLAAPAPRRHTQRWVEVTAHYWHFMDGLWIYLLVLLFS